MLGWGGKHIESKGAEVFGTLPSFGESKERVSIPLSRGSCPSAKRSSWNLLVSNQRFMWCFRSDGAGASLCRPSRVAFDDMLSPSAGRAPWRTSAPALVGEARCRLQPPDGVGLRGQRCAAIMTDMPDGQTLTERAV